MKSLILKIPRLLRSAATRRISFGGKNSALNDLSDRSLEDIGLHRHPDRSTARPFWMP